MTFRKHALRAAALGLAALLAPAARAQFPTIDVGMIAKGVEIIDKVQEEIDKTEEVRARIDDMTDVAADPYAALAATRAALGATAWGVPAALGTPRPPGERLRARLDGRRAPLPSEPTNAALLAPPEATPAQVEAALRPTVANDPLAGDAAARLARERLLRDRARQRIAAGRTRALEQIAAESLLAGTIANVRDAAAAAWGRQEAATDRSWTALLRQSSAQTQTLGVLQSQLLALELAKLERETMQRQDALERAAADRVAALQALAASKARHRAYEADPDRDAGDDLLDDCGGRFFSCSEPLPPGF